MAVVEAEVETGIVIAIAIVTVTEIVTATAADEAEGLTASRGFEPMSEGTK